jgi:hypothetical protein
MFCTQSEDEDSALCIGQKTSVRMSTLREAGIQLEELAEVSGHDDSKLRNERSIRNPDEPKETRRTMGFGLLLQSICLKHMY